jgi:hypothetical protein
VHETEATTKSLFEKPPVAQLLKNFPIFYRHANAEKIEIFMNPTLSHENRKRSSVRNVVFF